jgi:hypothetical protein
MKQLFGRKDFALALGILAILVLVILAGGMDSLEFRKGTPFTYALVNETSSSRGAEPQDMGWIFVLVLAVTLVVSIFVLVVASPKQRRIILALLLGGALVFLGLMWWMSRGGSDGTVSQPTATAVHSPENPQATMIPVSTPGEAVIYTAPVLSPWISIGITFVILSISAFLAAIYWRKRLRESESLEALAGIVEQAASDLQSGKEYGDVVINCYARMVEAVDKQRGIRRRGNLTPEEFIAVLNRARLPENPTRHLTGLFERVRYGGRDATQSEIDEAVACMNEIVAAIREGR